MHNYVLLTGEYGAGCWANLTLQDSQAIHRTEMDVYRIVDGSARQKPREGLSIKSHLKVAADLGVMLPANRVVFARIKLLTHVLKRSRADILTLLYTGRKAKQSWLAAVEADLIFVAAITPNLADLRHAELATWIKFLLDHGKNPTME